MRNASQLTEDLRLRLEEKGGLRGSCKRPPVLTPVGMEQVKAAFKRAQDDALEHAAASVCDGCRLGWDVENREGERVHVRENEIKSAPRREIVTECFAYWRAPPEPKE